MEDQTAILASAMRQDPFEIVMRGYNRRQVDDFVARSRDHVRDLEARLGMAADAAEQARHELAGAREQPANRPAHEEVSERLSQILRLAAEEAEQERSKAEGEITQLRQTAEQEIGTLVQDARDEAEEILSSVRAEADQTLNRARQDSQRMLDSAREEAEHVVADATDHAERVRRQAEHRASVVNGVLTDRLAALTDAHGLAVRRLAEIESTLSGLLGAEEAAGPLAAAITFDDKASVERVDEVAGPDALGTEVLPEVAADPAPSADEVATETLPGDALRTPAHAAAPVVEDDTADDDLADGDLADDELAVDELAEDELAEDEVAAGAVEGGVVEGQALDDEPQVIDLTAVEGNARSLR